MPDDEILCSLTEQGNFGLGVGEVTNKKDQEAIKAMQERQKQLSKQKRYAASACEAYCMDD